MSSGGVGGIPRGVAGGGRGLHEVHGDRGVKQSEDLFQLIRISFFVNDDGHDDDDDDNDDVDDDNGDDDDDFDDNLGESNLLCVKNSSSSLNFGWSRLNVLQPLPQTREKNKKEFFLTTPCVSPR